MNATNSLSQEAINHLQQRIRGLKPSLIGRICYYLIPYRRKIVLNNMKLVFGEVLSPAQIKKLAKCFYSHIMLCIWEMLVMRCISTEKFTANVEVRNHETVVKAAAENRGILILTAHVGNWEYAPIAGVLQFKQYAGRFHIIRKTIGVKIFEKLLFKKSYDAGINVITKKNALFEAKRLLNKNDVIVFVMDQRASVKRRIGVLAEFFGHKVGTYRSLACLAKETNAPVIPAVTYRDPQGKHVLEYFEPLTWQHADSWPEERYLNTLQYNQVLEKFVLAYPEQWLWMHKRWVIN